jgi:hypothetical protein
VSATGGAPRAMGANEATPAEAARGAGATTGATAVTVQWATAAVALAPTQPGSYEDTPVGRLPTGPAADAALAAAAAHGPAPGSHPSATLPPDGRRGEPRAAWRRPALRMAAAGALGVAAAAVVARRRRRRRPRFARFIG